MKDKELAYFMHYQKKVLGVVLVRSSASDVDIYETAAKQLRNSYKKHPGDFAWVDFRLIVNDHQIHVEPQNFFTALYFANYSKPPKDNIPFINWKDFVIGYHPKCTGFFLV
jgi:hypothetical protein